MSFPAFLSSRGTGSPFSASERNSSGLDRVWGDDDNNGGGTVFDDLDAGVGELAIRPLSMSPMIAGGVPELAGASVIIE